MISSEGMGDYRDWETIVTGEHIVTGKQPAAAVIRRVQALIGITGRKARVGGPASGM